jgi:DNA ligase 1
MHAFADLFDALDQTSATRAKHAALCVYFRQAADADVVWALHLLLGGKVRGGAKGSTTLAKSSELQRWIGAHARLPDWLVTLSYEQVGDLAETLHLLAPIPSAPAPVPPLSTLIECVLQPLAGLAEADRQAVITQQWASQHGTARLLFNKLLTGNLRIGVSRALVQSALSDVWQLPVDVLAKRLMSFMPTLVDLHALKAPLSELDKTQGTYPFYLASAVELDANTSVPLEAQLLNQLGSVHDWQLEWKWDGIRAQMLCQRDIGTDGAPQSATVQLLSRGEEDLQGRFPELELALQTLPACVLDGEIVAWDAEHQAPGTFQTLQTRIQRKKPSAKLLQQNPVRFIGYDLLRLGDRDLRAQPLSERRAALQRMLAHANHQHLMISDSLVVTDWQHAQLLRMQARAQRCEGLMLKRKSSIYQQGRKRGDWWKWKLDPLSFDAVLLYAQAGHGRRANLYTDYTFGVWHQNQLLPIAKAYSGLDQQEINQVDRWIRAHTLEKFGPVRKVSAELVFELGFEAIQVSKRHRAGVALRFPRILRWRHDKKAADADQLSAVCALANLSEPITPRIDAPETADVAQQTS